MIHKKSFGEDDVKVGDICNAMGNLLWMEEKLDECPKRYKESRRIWKMALHEENSKIAGVLNSMALVHHA